MFLSLPFGSAPASRRALALSQCWLTTATKRGVWALTSVTSTSAPRLTKNSIAPTLPAGSKNPSWVKTPNFTPRHFWGTFASQKAGKFVENLSFAKSFGSFQKFSARFTTFSLNFTSIMWKYLVNYFYFLLKNWVWHQEVWVLRIKLAEMKNLSRFGPFGKILEKLAIYIHDVMKL